MKNNFRKNSIHIVCNVSLSRALSKSGFCSRVQALHLIKAGRVKVNEKTEHVAARWIDLNRDRISVDDKTISKVNHIYLMLNKPRGLVTTMSDEKGRATVYQCFNQTSLPRLIPVGRLDKASEGLLLFTNDTAWADRITDPASHLDKIYHIQIDQIPDEIMIEMLTRGIPDQLGKMVKRPAFSPPAVRQVRQVKRARILRSGKKNGWLEIVLDEGKNRYIRRILEGLDIHVLRLIRIAIGPLSLGDLAKGQFRTLRADELKALHNVLDYKNGTIKKRF